MHGHTPPELFETRGTLPPATFGERLTALGTLFRAHRAFILVVILPMVCAGLYLGPIESNQYVSEAHFVVRAAGNGQAAGSGIGQLLGIGSTLPPSQAESLALGDYLTSHDAIKALQPLLDLTRLFQRRDIDPLSRLQDDPAPETVLKFYRRQVELHYSSETGITTLKVRAFRPEDAYRIASTLLDLGEARVNRLNKRAFDEPNLPVKSLYPARWWTLLSILAGLLVTYAIGWLIAAGVREHAA